MFMWKYIVVYWLTYVNMDLVSHQVYSDQCKCWADANNQQIWRTDTSRKNFKYRKDAIQFMKVVEATDSRLDSIKVR